MSEGFDVEVEMPKEDINRLLKQYKKLEEVPEVISLSD